MIDRANVELKYKDLIIISNSNFLEVGIFKRKGSVGNLNYYTLCEYNLNILKGGNSRRSKPYTSYINTNRNTRYLKITEDQLRDEEKFIYQEMIKLL